MVCAQLVAFGRVSQRREEGREKKRVKESAATNTWPAMNGDARDGKFGKGLPNGYGKHMNGGQALRKLSTVREETYFD